MVADDPSLAKQNHIDACMPITNFRKILVEMDLNKDAQGKKKTRGGGRCTRKQNIFLNVTERKIKQDTRTTG